MTEANPYSSPEVPEESLPQSREVETQGPSGIGGWLILVAIGLIMSPFALLASLLLQYLPIYTSGTWQSLTAPSSEFYHPLWGPILIFETIATSIFLVLAVALLVLFFRKSRSFPKFFIILAIAHPIYILVGAWLASFVLQDDPQFGADTAGDLSRAAIYAAIWVPYMVKSRRVNNTFVE